MNDARCVRGLETTPGLGEHGDDLARLARAFGQPLPQRAAGQVLHREEHVIAERADVEDRHDIAMRQLRHCLRLAQHSLLRARVVTRGDELERDGAVQARIARRVDNAHRACTGDALDDVAADRGAGREPCGLRVGARRADRHRGNQLGARAAIVEVCERGDPLRIGQGVADEVRDRQIVEAAHPRSHDSRLTPIRARSRSSR
jgi:hypothetical protein